MNDDNLLTNPIQKAINEANELKEKQFIIQKKRTEIQYKQVQRQEEMENAFDNLPIGENIAERYEKLAKENKEYIQMAKNGGIFLGMDIFKDKIALFPRNIILISAETGTGKSTTVAKFIESYVKQGKRVLVITNEEYPNDILNRVVFLVNNWIYSDHESVTEEQMEVLDKAYKVLPSRLEIIHDAFNNGVGGTTTTLEGIISVCETLKRKVDNGDKPYDAIIIDYIQNVASSVNTPSMASWQVLKMLGTYLDNFKGQYDAPIIMFSQLKADSSDGKAWKDRIEGYKAITNHATTGIELKIDRENLRTEWKFTKNRFKGAVGNSVFTGYDKGRFIPYDNEFKQRTLVKNEKKKHAGLMGGLFDSKEKK